MSSNLTPPSPAEIERFKRNIMAMTPEQQAWMCRFSYLSRVGDLVTGSLTTKMLDGRLSREHFWELVDRQYDLHMEKLKAEGMAILRRLAEEQGVNPDDFG